MQKPETEDLDKAKEIAREGFKKAKEFFPKEKEVKVGFGWTERESIKENMNGASGLSFSSEYFEIDFNSEVEGWKNSVLGTSIHEYAHTYFYEARDMDSQDEMPMWLYILSEALTQNTTKKLAPEASEPWRTKHSKEDIAEYWNKIKKEELERIYQYPYPLFIDKSEEEYPNWLGYSLAYQIGQQLIEEGYNLEDFPELEKEQVIEAGNKLFGNGS